MKNQSVPKEKPTAKRNSVGQELATRLRGAIAWAGDEEILVRMTAVENPKPACARFGGNSG